MEFINQAYLLIGGNVGNMVNHLEIAVDTLVQQCGEVIKKSAIYKTAAWGNTEQAPFLNQALLIHTRLSAQQLMQKILSIEEAMGRIRLEKYGPRIIDIDILLFNCDIIAEPALVIPHPQLQHRLFALTPLAEIAADYLHPVLFKTVDQLKTACTDELSVEKLVSPGMMG